MTEEQFTKLLDQQLAKFFGEMTRHFDNRFTALETKFDKRIDVLQNQLDGVVTRLEDVDTESTALSQKTDRHEKWIGQLADTTGTTLVPKQRAI